MKYIFAILFISLFTDLSAQDKQFDKDEQGKFIYYKVVDSQTLGKAVLLERAKSFIALNKKSMKLELESDSSVLAHGKFVIDKTILVAGHPSGEVSYQFVFEVKEGKYRYWLTDFKYIPYQRDRYGNFVSTTHIGTPLEKQADKLNTGTWKDIQASTYGKAVKFGDALKKYLATDKKTPVAVKKQTISTKKW